MKRLLATIGLLCVSGAVFSATIKGNDENCMYLAYNFDNLAMYRDAGTTWSEAKPVLVNAVAESMTMPNGLVRDAEDGIYVMALADKLWNGELAGLPPGLVGVRVYDMCMGAAKVKQI